MGLFNINNYCLVTMSRFDHINKTGIKYIYKKKIGNYLAVKQMLNIPYVLVIYRVTEMDWNSMINHIVYKNTIMNGDGLRYKNSYHMYQVIIFGRKLFI